MNKIFVFDIDGTMANNKHRSHWLMSKPKNWKAYNATMADDGLYEDMAWVLQNYYDQGHHIVFATGREGVHYYTTTEWLKKMRLPYHNIYMRKIEDYRKDSEVKVEILNQIRGDLGEPYLWFDDRQQVVDAIRAEGVRVLQVQAGDF